MKTIDAVLMVRKIRDKQHQEISNKSTAEIMTYFRKKASEINRMAAKFQLHQD